MSKDVLIGILSLVFILTMAGVDPLRALVGSTCGVIALACMMGAGLSWLAGCCPDNRHVPPTIMGLIFAGLTVTAFII